MLKAVVTQVTCLGLTDGLLDFVDECAFWQIKMDAAHGKPDGTGDLESHHG